jgi:hypothetical protein
MEHDMDDYIPNLLTVYYRNYSKIKKSADNISDEHTDRCFASPLANRFIA